MADRPIIFSAPMVRALLEGRKTQTRRLLKMRVCGGRQMPVPPDADGVFASRAGILPCAPGDRLWVRETFAYPIGSKDAVRRYRADLPFGDDGRALLWRSPIHMPRWASRLTLAITDVRVQRLQEISAEDCTAEGIPFEADALAPYEWSVSRFIDLWNSIHGPDAWDANPWVAAITFTVDRCNIDQMEIANAHPA